MPQRKVEIIWEEEEKFIRNVTYKVRFYWQRGFPDQWVWLDIIDTSSNVCLGIRVAHYLGDLIEHDYPTQNFYLE